MNDEHYLKEKYADLLGENPGPNRLRLISHLEDLTSVGQPPEHIVASISRTLQESAAARAGNPGSGPGPRRPAPGEREGAIRRVRSSVPWLLPLRRGLGVAGFAGFALIVAVIVIGLSAVLPRMNERTAGAPPQSTDTGAAPGAVGTARPEAQISPLLAGTGVLHIKGTEEWRTHQGELVYRFNVEFWYDRATGDARYHRKNVFGFEEYEYVLLREGQRYAMYSPTNGDRTIEAPTSKRPLPAMPMPVDEMFRTDTYSGDRSRLVKVGEDVFEGKQVVVLARKSDGERVLYIDKEKRLPLQGVNISWGHNGKSYKGTEDFEYSVIEVLDRASLPEDLFSVDTIINAPWPPRVEPTVARPTYAPRPPEPTFPPHPPEPTP